MPQYSRKVKAGIRHYYKFDYKGITYTSPAIFLSKFEAKKAESQRLEEAEQHFRNPSLFNQTMSLRQAINERLDYVMVKRTDGYYKDNKRYYKLLLETIGDIPLSEIKKGDVLDILLSVSQKQQTKAGDNYVVNSMLATYKALFNFIIDKHELGIVNPCFKIKSFSVNKKIKYIPSDQDIETVRKHCDEEQRQLLDFALTTGCRIGESLNLLVDDVFDEFVVLYTRKSANSNKVPRRVPRPIDLDVSGLEPGQRVFGRWSDTPKFLEKKIKALKQIPWNWHNCRHRRASLWHKEGKTLLELMMLLGHSNLKTTQQYLQLIG